MNLKPLFSLSLISSALLLAACGSDSDSSSSSSNNMDDDGHDHGASARILMTSGNSNDLTIFDQADDKFEALGQAAAMSGELIRSDDGLSAAVVTASGVEFVYSGIHAEEHDEGEEQAEASAAEEAGHDETHGAEILTALTLTGTDLKVSMTQNHFAVLKDGNTHFYPAAELEEATTAEDTLELTGVTQTYPAAILDEEHGLRLVFAKDKAIVYEGTEETETVLDCESPTAVVKAHEMTLAQCDTGLIAVVVEEHEHAEDAHAEAEETSEEEPVIEAPTIDLGTLEISKLVSNGHKAVTVGSGVALKSVTWKDDKVVIADMALETEATAICDVDFATADTKSAILTNDGRLHFTDLKTNETRKIELDDSNDSATCADWTLTSGSQAFVVTDSDVSKMYYIDSHDGHPYHIHEKFPMDAGTDVAAAAMLHASGVEDDHDH